MEGIQPTRFLVILATDNSNTADDTKITLSHLAPVYYLFKDMGADVVLTTLTGEYPELFDIRDKTPQEQSVRRFIDDRTARDELADTLGLHQIAVEDFDAVFCLGSAKTLWDHESHSPQTFLVSFLESGKPVAIFPGQRLKPTADSITDKLLIVEDASGTPLTTAHKLLKIIAEQQVAHLDKTQPLNSDD